MATKYPEQIDGNSELPLTTDNVTPVKAEVVNNLRGAILAIERELGADPSREFGTVRTRLDALETRIASLESSGGGGGGPGTLTIKSSGSTVVSAASILDFIGADVVLSDTGTAQITILGGGADSKQESVSVSNGQTSFSLAETPLEANTVMMFVNGAKQEYSTDYTVSGTTVTWNDTFVLQSTDIVEFWYLVEGSGGSSGGEIGSLGEVLTQGNTSDGYDILLSAGDDLVLSSTSTITSSGSLIELAKDTKISGELTLTGILDETTGLRLLQQGSIPASASAGTGVVWIRSSDKKLIYTDDDSTTHILNPDSGGTPTWAQILASGADSGATNPRVTSNAVLLFQQRSASIGGVPTHGYLWVKDDSPTSLYFTDSGGTDHDLLSGGGSGDATSLLSIDLDTTSFGSPIDGYVITYDSGSGEFVLEEPSATASGDATSLLGIDLDVTSFGSPIDGYAIIYDNESAEFILAKLPDGLEEGATGTVLAGGSPNEFTANPQITSISLGSPVASAGDIRMGTAASINGRTAGGSNFPMIGVNSDILVIGDSSIGDQIIYASTGDHTFARGTDRMLVIGDRQTTAITEDSSGIGLDHGLKSSFHEDGQSSAIITLQKSRGTFLSPSGVSNADDIGALIFSAYNGDDSAYDTVAGIVARVVGVPSAGSIPTALDINVGDTVGSLVRMARFLPNLSTGSDSLDLGRNTNDFAILYNGVSALTFNDGSSGFTNIAFVIEPSSSDWNSGDGVLFIGDANTAPSAVDGNGAFLWADNTTSELRSHRARLIDYLAIGTDVSSEGNIRVTDDFKISARSVNGVSDRDLLTWSNSDPNFEDTVIVGDTGNNGLVFAAGSTGVVAGIGFVVNDFWNMRLCDGYFELAPQGNSLPTTGTIRLEDDSVMVFGLTTANAGAIRLPNNESIQWRNSTDSANASINYNGSNVLQINGGTGQVQLTGSGGIVLSNGVTAASTISVSASGHSTSILNTGITFGNSANDYTISQTTNSTASATGRALIIQAQNTSGASSTGGNLLLKSGDGTGADGVVAIQPGGSNGAVFVGGFVNVAQSGNIRVGHSWSLVGRNQANGADIELLGFGKDGNDVVTIADQITISSTRTTIPSGKQFSYDCVHSFGATVQTTDDSLTELTTYDPGTSKAGRLSFVVVGKSSTSTNVYSLAQSYETDGSGNVSLLGSLSTTAADEDEPTWDVALDVDGTSITIDVRGAAATTVDWTVSGQIMVV